MQKLYLLAGFLLFYIFYKRIVDGILVLIGVAEMNRIKYKVFLYHFLSPIFISVLIFFVILTDSKVFNIYAGLGIIIGNIIHYIFNDNKYLAAFNKNDTHLELVYYSSAMRRKKIIYEMNDVTDTEFVKANWLFDDMDSFNINSNGKWNIYNLIDKTVQTELKKIF